MKVLKLTASHFKRLVAVEIEPDPDGNLVVVSGANAQGKSSVLDALMAALGGAGTIRTQTHPIHEGEDRAAVEVVLAAPDGQQLKVTRTWQAGKPSTLVVEDPEGRIRSPQALLDKLVGALSFDPVAFAQKLPRDQLSDLLHVVDLPFEPEELERQRQRLFDRRTDENRDLKALRARLDAAPPPVPNLPEEEISSAEVLAQLDVLVAQKAENDKLRDELRTAEREVSSAAERARLADDVVAELERRLDEARQVATQMREEAESAAEHRGSLRDRVLELEDPDQGPLREQLTTLEETNRQIRQNRARAELRREVDAAVARVAEIEARMADIDAQKAAGVAAAKMPVEGLSFDAEGITYNGVPFAQASSAEQLRVSTAMAMALNPDLRVIRITDGSLLDSHSMAMLQELAAENDYQVWIEVVDEGEDAPGVVIEDGRVRS